MSDVDDLVARAEHLTDLGHVEEALRLLGRAIVLDPGHLDALCAVSRTHLVGGDYDQARTAAEAVLATDPDAPYASFLWASALVAAEHPDAVPAAEAALRLNPDFWPAYGRLARALLGVGQPAQALDVARRGLALAPEEAAAHRMLAGIAQDTKQHKLAEREYHAALRLEPDDADARLGLATLHFERRRIRTGAEHLVAAVARRPRSAELVDGLRGLVSFGMVISLCGIGAAALVAIVALIAGAFSAAALAWAQMLCGVMALLLSVALLFLATRVPRSALPLVRSMIRTNRNRLIPIGAGAVTVLLLSAFALTAQRALLVVLVVIALPAFFMLDQVVEDPDPSTEERPKTVDDILY